jgi:hypothetical protein
LFYQLPPRQHSSSSTPKHTLHPPLTATKTEKQDEDESEEKRRERSTGKQVMHNGEE